MSKIEKDQKALQQEQENEVLQRVLCWLGVAAVLEIWVFFINRFIYNVRPTQFEIGMMETIFNRVLPMLQYGGIILAALIGLWHLGAKKKQEEIGIFRIVLAVFFASLAVCAMLFLHFGETSVPMLLVVIPSLAGIMMIYYLYQKEFFLISLASALGILGLWIFRSSVDQSQSLFYAYIAMVFCALIIIAVFAHAARKGTGTVKLGKKSLELFSPKASYGTIYITCALVAATLLLVVVTGALAAAVAYYSIMILVVWIFVMAVYFTSKLM